MTWTLHLVGQENPETVNTLMPELVAAVEAAGHVLTRAQLGTDSGSVDLDVSGEPLVIPDAAPVQTPTDDPVEDEEEVPTDTPPSL